MLILYLGATNTPSHNFSASSCSHDVTAGRLILHTSTSLRMWNAVETPQKHPYRFIARFCRIRKLYYHRSAPDTFYVSKWKSFAMTSYLLYPFVRAYYKVSTILYGIREKILKYALYLWVYYSTPGIVCQRFCADSTFFDMKSWERPSEDYCGEYSVSPM